MDNLEFYNKAREVPAEAQKTIGAGRLKGMTDINPMWRIKKLTELFGMVGLGWKTVITRKEMIPCGDEIAAFVDIELYVKYDGVDGEWSAAIPGTGGAMFAAKESKGIYVCDEAYKKAYTDAISVAAKAIGIGADVYWQADKTKYSAPAETPKEEVPQVDDATIKTLRNKLSAMVREIIKLTGKTKEEVCDYLFEKCGIENATTGEDYLKLIAYADVVITDNHEGQN